MFIDDLRELEGDRLQELDLDVLLMDDPNAPLVEEPDILNCCCCDLRFKLLNMIAGILLGYAW